MFLLNSLRTPDVVFFILIGVVVAICIAIYFLIPIIKRKEYAERRENLKKREEVFRANLKNLQAESVVVEKEKTDKKAKSEKNNKSSELANNEENSEK